MPRAHNDHPPTQTNKNTRAVTSSNVRRFAQAIRETNKRSLEPQRCNVTHTHTHKRSEHTRTNYLRTRDDGIWVAQLRGWVADVRVASQVHVRSNKCLISVCSVSVCVCVWCVFVCAYGMRKWMASAHTKTAVPHNNNRSGQLGVRKRNVQCEHARKKTTLDTRAHTHTRTSQSGSGDSSAEHAAASSVIYCVRVDGCVCLCAMAIYLCLYCICCVCTCVYVLILVFVCACAHT